MMADWHRELTDRLAALRLRPEREAEIVEELSQHLADHVQHLVAGGGDPADARAAALADLDQPGELARRLAAIEARPPLALPPPGAPPRGRWIRERLQDVRHSLRALRRAPGFTMTAVATLALTIGPTTAILSMGNWLLWRPTPGVSDADRLAVVWFGEWRGTRSVSIRGGVSYLNLDDLRRASRTLDGIAGLREGSVSLAAGALPTAVADSGSVTANTFDVLGVRLAAGRTFTPAEDQPPHGAHVAIVSEGLARRGFGSPDEAIGRRVLVNGRPLSIVGVLAAPFAGTQPFNRVDVWYPGATESYVHHLGRTDPPSRGDGIFYDFVVRLAPGATFDRAQAELDVLLPALADRYPDENGMFRTVRARMFPGLGPMVLQRAGFAREVRDLLIIGGVLLLLGCANVANLLMMRGVRTRRERVIRLALGASRARLVQLQLTESALVALAGGALGLALALWLTQFIAMLILPGFAPGTLPEVPLDARVLAMTFAVAVGCGLVAGVIPGLVGANVRTVPAFADAGGRSISGSRRLRTGLAVVQLALSLALVVGALLLVTSLRHLYRVDLGFDPAGVSVHELDPGRHGYTPDRFALYQDGILQRVSGAPGIAAASLSFRAPFGSGRTMELQDPAGGERDRIETYANAVSATYFDTLGVPVLRGRGFLPEELAPRSGVTVISARLARRLFGDAEPIGRRIVLAGRSARELRVVGVAGDTHWRNVTGEPDLLLYLPWGDAAIGTDDANLIVKSAMPLRDVVARVEAAAADVDPTLPVNWSVAMSSRIDEELSDQRVFAWMLSLLGWLGFTLAAVGLYGLLAQSVSERTREFGIRIALGSDRRGIFGLVLRQAGWIGALGTAIGLVLASVGSRLIESQLYGVTRLDPVVNASAAALLAGVVLAAGLWPARTATRIQPVEALRE
jgi:putative ABC transport system permease protein